jgi:hypothetical protein
MKRSVTQWVKGDEGGGNDPEKELVKKKDRKPRL